MTETKLSLQNILYTGGLTESKEDLRLKKSFCGIVVDTMEQLVNLARKEMRVNNGRQEKILYFTGKFEDPPVCLLA